MQKLNKYFKHTFKYVFTVLMFFVIVFVNCTQANAGLMAKETETTKKERQLIEKIKLIHEVFPSQTDEFALYATLVHRGTLTDYVNDSYDPNFDENKYKDSVIKATDSVQNVGSNKKATSADILLAATIVMLDSSGWIGTYSDDNYKKALAGNKLVGNMLDGNPLEDLLGNGFNSIFCVAGAAVDTIATPLEFGADFLQGNGDTAFQTKAERYVTMTNVCTKGFIGGTYSHVKNFNTEGKTEEETKKLEEQLQLKKDKTADEIIKLAKHFRGVESNDCIVNPTASSGVWKQAGQEWSDINLGSSSKTVASSGCLITSLSMLMARSGTQITNLPSGYDTFNPGALVTTLNKNEGFIGANFAWRGQQSIAPNWNMGTAESFSTDNSSTLATKISEELSQPAEGKYQKFILLQIYYNGGANQHWVAVDGVNNGQVIISDPGGPDGNTLDNNYTDWRVNSYRVMYATDVLFGQSGSSTLNSGSTNYCTGSGEIVIPEEFGRGGFTVTYYLNSDNSWNWAKNSKQGELYYNHWLTQEPKFDQGIAVYQGRYLIACTDTFGEVGDMVDFFLEDGTKIPCIIADEKSQTVEAWDHNPANKWGHNNGQNVLEFEVSKEYSKSHNTNPGNNTWFPEWKGKRVASATNLGQNILNS